MKHTPWFTLYKNLMDLTAKSECFYFTDTVLDDVTYRVFSYRIASYSDFLEQSALECRGHMFEIKDEQAVRLATLPPEKFFNLGENAFTTGLDLSTIKSVTVKADGSLISTFLHNNHLCVKSKTSLQSSQAVDAQAWLDRPENVNFKLMLFRLGIMGITVNMEWCAPSNQIVLGYAYDHLTILNARRNTNGEYVNIEEIFPELSSHMIEKIKVDDPQQLIDSMHTAENIEGYVIELDSGQKVKIKTDWYLLRHRAKDSVSSLSALFELILREQIDDVKTLFAADQVTIDKINKTEQIVAVLYNHLVASVESFYLENKELIRKEYAILGQSKLTPTQFGLAMLKFQNKPVDYKQFMIDHFDKFKPSIIEQGLGS